MKLLLVRHGQSLGNISCAVYKEMPQTEIGLSEKGVQQCQSLRSVLVRNKILTERTICIHSPLKRAQHTAEILCDLGPQYHEITRLSDPFLVEQWWGEANGWPSFDSYINNCPNLFKREAEKELYKSTGFFYYRPPRGESLADVYQRVGTFLVLKDFFRGYFSEFQNVLLVAHSSVVQILEKHITGCEINEKFITEPNSVWGNCHTKVYTISGWDSFGPKIETIEYIDPE